MESCPHCKRGNFSSKSGRTLHIKSCRGAAAKIEDPKPKKKSKKNTATLANYKHFHECLTVIADRMRQNQDDLVRIADIADSVGHDGFAVYARYFANTKIKTQLDSIIGYAQLYTETGFKESKKPQPWD